MAVQLFNLRGVPEDEAAEMRALLAEHDIDFYETPAGSWGISLPALWLNDEAQLDLARQLLSDYQQQRAAAAHADYVAQKRAGQQRRMLDLFRERPLIYLLFLLVIALILYLSISPYLKLAVWRDVVIV